MSELKEWMNPLMPIEIRLLVADGEIKRLRAQLAASEARAERYEAALVAVQNFPSHPGGQPDDQSSDADDAASWRHGWICAVGAMQDRALPGEQTKAETDFEISILRAKVAAYDARAALADGEAG